VLLKKCRLKIFKERKENERKEKGLGDGRTGAFQSRPFHSLRLQDTAFVSAIQRNTGLEKLHERSAWVRSP